MFLSSDSKLLEFEILENSSIFYQILASTRVLELKKKLDLTNRVTSVKLGYNEQLQTIHFCYNWVHLCTKMTNLA